MTKVCLPLRRNDPGAGKYTSALQAERGAQMLRDRRRRMGERVTTSRERRAGTEATAMQRLRRSEREK
jgi:hypothetical protein